jgi:hypothetical protein
MAKRKNSNGAEVSINDVRASIRSELEKKYGSIAKFMHHKDSEKFGGRKIRCYLYDSGSVNFEVISGLAKWLGLGELKRSVIVTRSYKYVLSEGQKGE